MSRNLSLTTKQARLLIDQLLEEPLLASPTADELVHALLRGDGALARQLFNRVAVDLVMALPEEQRRHVAEHMHMMAERMDAAVARAGRAAASDRVELGAEQARRGRERVDTAEAALARNAVTVEVSSAVAKHLEDLAKSLSRPSSQLVVSDALEASAEAIDACAVLPQEPVARRDLPAARRAVGPKCKFSDLEAAYLADKQRGGYSMQTVQQVRATFRLWTELLGDKPVGKYTGTDAGRFRELVLRLPASHGKGGRINANDAIRTADLKEAELRVPVPRLTMKTAKRHFSALSQYWEWLRPRDHIEKNIFRGFEFPGTKSQKKLRSDWSDEDLLKLFSSRWFSADVECDSAQRWIPVIAMLSGLRLEEICRLRPAYDVVDLAGLPTLNIPAFKIQEHLTPEQWSPKSEAGERIVPIHPVLQDLGFLELVARRRAEGAQRIFPELRPMGPDQKLGAEFSRRFGKLKEAAGVGKKTVFHSFRHSVRTILGNTEVKDSWIDAVMGHEGGETSVGITVYLKRIGMLNLLTVIETIRYSDEVMAGLFQAMGQRSGQ
jgi:integrase